MIQFMPSSPETAWDDTRTRRDYCQHAGARQSAAGLRAEPAVSCRSPGRFKLAGTTHSKSKATPNQTQRLNNCDSRDRRCLGEKAGITDPGNNAGVQTRDASRFPFLRLWC
jgi:hypothetical protein